MNFQRGRGFDEPEINLIPLIDVLLVIIIFLMLTTTYAKFSGIEINLPTADSSKQAEQPNEVNVEVTAGGQSLLDIADGVGAQDFGLGGRGDHGNGQGGRHHDP